MATFLWDDVIVISSNPKCWYVLFYAYDITKSVAAPQFVIVDSNGELKHLKILILSC